MEATNALPFFFQGRLCVTLTASLLLTARAQAPAHEKSLSHGSHGSGKYDGLHGNANPKLAQAVTKYLNIPLGSATVNRFSDGEVMVQLLDNVRGKDVFILQSTCAPTNDNLMELMIMVDALKRASARRITAAIPYYGYARQDRRPRSTRVAISAKVVANMLQAVGVDRVLTMDLHADQIQGFFDIPSTTSTPPRFFSTTSSNASTTT